VAEPTLSAGRLRYRQALGRAQKTPYSGCADFSQTGGPIPVASNDMRLNGRDFEVKRQRPGLTGLEKADFEGLRHASGSGRRQGSEALLTSFKGNVTAHDLKFWMGTILGNANRHLADAGGRSFR